MTLKMTKPKPKPSTSGQPIFIRLPDELRDRLDVLCLKEDRNLSSMIRVLIVEALEARQRGNGQ